MSDLPALMEAVSKLMHIDAEQVRAGQWNPVSGPQRSDLLRLV
jgi:hypothetical protein